MLNHTMKTIALLLSTILVFTAIPNRNAAALGDTGSGMPSVMNLPPSKAAKRGMEDIETRKALLSPAERKIGSDLLKLMKPELIPTGRTRDQLIRQMQSQKQIVRAATNGVQADSLLVYVYIRMVRGADVNMIKPYVNEIKGCKPDWGLVAAMVDTEKLLQLAELDSVLNIQTVIPPKFAEGSVTSEGDSVLGADLARALGNLDGTGVKIGVISDGVEHIASSIKSGDLPKNVNVLEDFFGGDEGTAMLEIIHDLAPAASLCFHEAGYSLIDYQEAVGELVKAGCDIIVDDTILFTQSFFSDDDLNEYINSLLDNNVIMVCAAGNYAQWHYQGKYRKDGKTRYHDFSNGKSKYKDLYAELPPGTAIDIYLEWNDPYGYSTNDYDLEVYDYNTGWLIEESTNDQVGYGSYPCEHVVYLNESGRTQILDICVSAFANQSMTLELYMEPLYGSRIFSDNIVPSDSIFGHQTVPNVITCGAVDCLSPSTIEQYSGRGPVTLLNGTRKKPDICGVDGVSITGAGGVGGSAKTYFGTSAAAAHVAAIAALIWQNHPELTAADVKARICANATDLGAKGYDTTYGYGRADAYYAALDFYEVDFIANGGSKDFTWWVPVGSFMPVPTTSPMRTGYSFTGWYTEPECKMLWDFVTGAVDSDMKLYAGWKPITYTISFDLLDGNAPATISADYGAKITEPTTPTRQSYIFGGWYVDKACKTPWRFDTDLVPGNMTLYAKMVPEVLPAPAGAQQTGTAFDRVTLGWQSVQYADGYEIWRSVTADGTFDAVGTVNTNSYTEVGLTFNTLYYYKVRAFYQSTTMLYGDYSPVFSATPLPSAPALKAVVASYKSIRITWGAVTQATNYELYRATSPSGSYQLLTTTSACSYTNANVTPGTTYYYRARAYTLVSGNKAYGFYSSVVSAKATVAIPAGVKTARASSSSVKVTWSKVADATKYEVWRCTTSASNSFALVGTVSATNFTDKKLKAGSTYWYKVRAYRLEKEKKIYGDYSKVVTAKP